MVLEYRVRQPAVAFAPEDRTIRTVVSKQWIPKDVLIEAQYEHTTYGEGSYSIAGKLTNVSLTLYSVVESIVGLRSTASCPSPSYRCVR